MDTVASPVFSPSGGSYTSSQSVKLSSSTSGATIHYTTDGSTPTTSSTTYTTPVTVSSTTTLKAIAVKSAMATSPVGSATFTISTTVPKTTIPWNTNIGFDSISYAGQTYRTVKIGKQTWMAENLNVEVDSSWWYEGSAENGFLYGRLYTWVALMDLPDSCYAKQCSTLVQPKHQGICPTGWHVSTQYEWDTLAYTVGGVFAHDTAGRMLKSKSGWLRENSSTGTVDRNGSDQFGFRLLPGGQNSAGKSEGIGMRAWFWTATSAHTSDEAMFEHFESSRVSYTNDGMGTSFAEKWRGYSARCVKD